MEWTWITVLEGFVSAAETAALIAAGRRAGYQRSSKTIRCFAAAMDSSSAGLLSPSHQLNYSEEGENWLFFFKSVAFFPRLRPTVRRVCARRRRAAGAACAAPRRRRLLPPIPVVLFCANFPMSALTHAPLLPLPMLLWSSPLLGPEPPVATARTVDRVPRRRDESVRAQAAAAISIK